MFKILFPALLVILISPKIQADMVSRKHASESNEIGRGELDVLDSDCLSECWIPGTQQSVIEMLARSKYTFESLGLAKSDTYSIRNRTDILRFDFQFAVTSTLEPFVHVPSIHTSNPQHNVDSESSEPESEMIAMAVLDRVALADPHMLVQLDSYGSEFSGSRTYRGVELAPANVTKGDSELGRTTISAPLGASGITQMR